MLTLSEKGLAVLMNGSKAETKKTGLTKIELGNGGTSTLFYLIDSCAIRFQKLILSHHVEMDILANICALAVIINFDSLIFSCLNQMQLIFIK